jgi:oligopeptide transport system substrate-binding protein
MKASKWVSTAVALTLVGSVAIGCTKKEETPAASATGDTKASAAPAKNQELKLSVVADPPVLDGSKATSEAAFTIMNAINEGMYRIDKDGKAVPGLAKDFPKISVDGLTYTIDIRDNATWSDGQPVKAQDFVYSFKRTLDPTTAAEYGFMVAWIKGGEEAQKAKGDAEIKAALDKVGVKAISDKQLEITLAKPVTFFTQLLAFPVFFPQREDFVKAQGDKNGAEAANTLGAGPFKLTKWDHDQTLVLEKNDKYWDAANVKITKTTINVVKDMNAGLNLYESKAVDFARISGEQAQLYKGKPDLSVKKELTNTYLQFEQTKVPAFANSKIRQALSMAIDRQGFVDTVLMDGSSASTGLVPSGTSDGAGGDFRKAAGESQPKYDPAKAKQLLAEGLKELNMTELPKMKLLSDDTDVAKKSDEFILAQWKQNLGYEAEANPVPHKLRLDNSTKHDFQIVLSLWGADYNDPMTFLDMFITGGSFNDGEYKNADYDAKVKAAQTEADPAKRAKLLVDAEKILVEDAGVDPIYFRARPYLVRDNVQGIFLPAYGAEFETKWASIK